MIMVDGARPHTAIISKQLLQKLFGNNWTSMWPPNSPDLNLIENVWAIIDNRIRKKDLWSLKQMRRRVKAEWNKLDTGLLQRLWGDFKTRCELVHSHHYPMSAIEANGGAINR